MAATVLARDFYVDDLASGAATFEEAAALRDELIQLVHCLLGPTVVYAKMIIQVLWKLQLMWDELIPQEARSTASTTWFIPEMRNVEFPQMSMKVTLEESDFFQGFNSFNRLTGVIACCRSLRHNANQNNPLKFNGPLSEAELKMAQDCVIKRAQETAFATEIRCLSSNHNVDKASKLVDLNRFLDEGILKVEGRLTHSDLSYDEKHPILLPRNRSITRMIIVDANLMLKHAGT